MRTEQTPQWLDDLVSSESKLIVKQAKDNKLADIEKRIEAAETPEELDALEKELSELESSSEGDSTEGETEDKAKTESDEAVSSEDASGGDTDEEESDEDEEADVDLSSLMKEVKDIKKDVTSGKDEMQRKLLTEVERLNDQMGLNKIVDMNTTVDEQ